MWTAYSRPLSTAVFVLQFVEVLKCLWITIVHTSIATPLSLFKLPKPPKEETRKLPSFQLPRRKKKTRKIHTQIHAKPAYCCERFASPPVPGVMLWWTYICRLDPKMAHDWGNRSINLSCFILIATHSSHWNLKMILNLFDILRAISKNDSHSRINENMISNQHDTILYTYED